MTNSSKTYLNLYHLSLLLSLETNISTTNFAFAAKAT